MSLGAHNGFGQELRGSLAEAWWYYTHILTVLQSMIRKHHLQVISSLEVFTLPEIVCFQSCPKKSSRFTTPNSPYKQCNCTYPQNNTHNPKRRQLKL